MGRSVAPLPRLVRAGVHLLPGENLAAAKARLKAEEAKKKIETAEKWRLQAERQRLIKQAKEEGWVHPRLGKRKRRRPLRAVQGGRTESNRRRH